MVYFFFELGFNIFDIMTLSCKYSCFHQHIKPISIIFNEYNHLLEPMPEVRGFDCRGSIKGQFFS